MSYTPLELALVAVMTAGLLVSLFLPAPSIRRSGTAFFLGWFVPGAGHVRIGSLRKGLFFFAILAATYLSGLWISGFRAVSFEDNPFYYVGQAGCGLTLFLGHLLGAEKAYPVAGVPFSWFDPGLLYVCVPGLLNLVVAMNAADPRSHSTSVPVPLAVETRQVPVVDEKKEGA